ncbi:UNKNOWN [Stylonychia lemnae]|uniref:Protein YIF1 n=1 Tax=Stylonychia lemnae TaxID=5949 RepID=A0A078ALC6_STYLE|nr:UNKNOWN [Stylonychia lemnae]|eukprot:CDW81663.1 UNKNOWN [Stylonychia lemnae]
MQFGQNGPRMNQQPGVAGLGAQRIQHDPFAFRGGPVQPSALEETIQTQMNSVAGNLIKNYAMNQFNQTVGDTKSYMSFFSLDSIKEFFDVNNSYVLKKLRIILFPVTIKGEAWKRQVGGYDFNNQELPPREDPQAPDLYIPLMSFVTFILITGFYLGNIGGFDPEVLGYIYTKSMFLWFFETTIQKGCFYFLGFGNPTFFELLCYTGYKFVNLTIIIMVQSAFGYYASYLAFFLTSIMFFYFFFKTMNRFQSGNTLADHIKESGGFNKKSFLLVNSLAQVALIWILSVN